jgi:hypothetical protein
MIRRHESFVGFTVGTPLRAAFESLADRFSKERQFKTRWHHRKPSYWLRRDRVRPAGMREAPELVRFEVEPGVAPSDKPPVRIFLGTEAAQCRPERVFVWAVKQLRNPSRVYEIHLMKDLKGFDRQSWKTGFTNYRYAIPTLAGGRGRAIYNDVDQVYLADPAELFDLQMHGAGVLGITGRETSVMLIDCEKMIRYWSIDDAKTRLRHRHFRAITHDNGLWGRLPREWNARDHEFRAGQSKCLHFTTLQMQPWEPFPDQIRYAPHPHGQVWFDLERAADAARFTVFTKARPSRRFVEMLELYRVMHEEGERQLGLTALETFNGGSLKRHCDEVAKLVRETGARTILDYGAGKGALYHTYPGEAADGPVKSQPRWPGVKVTCYDPGYLPFSAPYEGRFEGVISTDVLEHIPEEDVPWVLDDLFAAAERFVYAVAACYPARKVLPNGENAHITLQAPTWWKGQLELAARRHPGVRWVLCTEEKPVLGRRRRLFSGGGNLARAA